MKEHEEGILLRIFIDESSRCKGHPLYEAIVKKAHELNLTGATVQTAGSTPQRSCVYPKIFQ